MMSTMAIPHVPSLPTYAGPPMSAPPPGAYYGTPPLILHPQIIPTSQMVNGTTENALQTRNYNSFGVPMIPVGGGRYNDGMQVVWHGEFSRLFSSFFPPYHWYLSITDHKPLGKWRCHGDSAKVRFCCQDCGNGWTSMKGRVNFWYHFDQASNSGHVQFKLYGQVCKKCETGRFEYVMWYPEEVAKVMFNLYNKVGNAYYGFPPSQIRVDRRPGRPRNQHNADLCQACRDGECDQGRPAKAVVGYIPSGMNDRLVNAQIIPMVNPQMQVVVGQPPVPNGPTPSQSGAIIPGVSAQPTYITTPVTISPSAHPILTYSVNSAEVKDVSKLPPVAEHVEVAEVKEEASSSLPNGHCADGEKKASVEQGIKNTKIDVKRTQSATTEKSMSEIIEKFQDFTTGKRLEPAAQKSFTKPTVNGVGFKPPVRLDDDIKDAVRTKSVNAITVFKEFHPVAVKENGLDENGLDENGPVINGYASAAKKTAPSQISVHSNA